MDTWCYWSQAVDAIWLYSYHMQRQYGPWRALVNDCGASYNHKTGPKENCCFVERERERENSSGIYLTALHACCFIFFFFTLPGRCSSSLSFVKVGVKLPAFTGNLMKDALKSYVTFVLSTSGVSEAILKDNARSLLPPFTRNRCLCIFKWDLHTIFTFDSLAEYLIYRRKNVSLAKLGSEYQGGYHNEMAAHCSKNFNKMRNNLLVPVFLVVLRGSIWARQKERLLHSG